METDCRQTTTDDRIEALATQLADLRAENERLAAEVAALRDDARPAADDSPEDGGPLSRGPLSRRRLLGLGGAAAAGAGAAVGAAILGARPAAASPSPDGDIHLGGSTSDNNAGTSPTGMQSNSMFEVLGAYQTGPSNNTHATALFGQISNSLNTDPAIWGNAAGGPGIYGTSATGPAVQGVINDNPANPNSNPAVSGVIKLGNGVALYGEGGRAQLMLKPAPGTGAPTDHHAQGELFLDHNAVLWICTASGQPGAPSTFVRAITSGTDNLSSSSAALQINQAGTGPALVGDITNSSSASLGVYGLTNGSGQGVKGYNTGTGMGVYGQVNNAANANPAVQGYTNGTGPAVEGNQAGTGYGVLGNVNNTSSSMAAVRAVTNGTGPALQGAGGRAQLNLVPSSASNHPTSGQQGDVFVDSTGRMWFCTVGGSTATWKQVQLV